MTETYWIFVSDRSDFLAGKPVSHMGFSESSDYFSITVEPDEVEVFKEGPDRSFWSIKLKHQKTK